MKLTPSQIEMLFKKTLRGLEDGTPLRQLLGKAGYPSRRKFYDWVKEDESMRERYARAKELAADALYDEMLHIARTPLEGSEITHGPLGVTVKTADALGHRRLLIDTIKWRLAKEKPEKYGDKLDVTSKGEALAVPSIIGMTIINEMTPNDKIEPKVEDDLN